MIKAGRSLTHQPPFSLVCVSKRMCSFHSTHSRCLNLICAMIMYSPWAPLTRTEDTLARKRDAVARSAPTLHKRTLSLTSPSRKASNIFPSHFPRAGQSPFFGGSRQLYHSPGPSLSNSRPIDFPQTSQPSLSDAPDPDVVRLKHPHDTLIAFPSQLSSRASRSLSSLAATSNQHHHSSRLFPNLSAGYTKPQIPRKQSVTVSLEPVNAQIGPSSRPVYPVLPPPKKPDIRNTPPPKRVLRPDHSWREYQYPARPLSQGPPAVPNRSPLRDLLPRHLPTTFKTSRPASSEEKALWEEFSPRPLRVRRDRQIHTSSDDGPEVGPKSSSGKYNHIPRFGNLNTPEYGLDEGLKVFAHRRRTLEILESSPISVNSKSHSWRLPQKEQHRKRAGFMMNSLHPDSAAALTAHRREAIRLAEDQQRVVSEKCKRSKQAEPDYAFEELIGKGSFGRVYKG